MKRKGVFTTENTESTEATVTNSVENPHDLPDDFQMTEFGPLPKEWRVVRLGEVLYEVPRAHRQVKIVDNELYTRIATKLYGYGIAAKELVRGSQIASKEMYRTQPGDFLFSKINIKKGAFGVVPPHLTNAVVTQEHPILRPKDDMLHVNYLDYYLKQPHTWERFKVHAKGFSGKERVKVREFLSVPIPLPPLPEQRAIAHVLRTVQRAKEATEGVIAALKELKKSLMQHLFTYGPAPVGAKNFSPQRETELGPLPKEWRVVRLGEIFDILQGKSLSARQNKGERPRPFLRTSNVYWGYLDLSKLDVMDFTEEEEQKFALQHGDLLVCEGGDVGRTAMWEGQIQGVYYQNHLHRLRARDNNVKPAFVMYWLQTAFTLLNLYAGSSNKTTIPNLSQGRLAVFPIPLPPLSEQREIARILQAVDAKIVAEQARRAALEELFKTLLQELMSGKRRVGFTTENTEDTER